MFVIEAITSRRNASLCVLNDSEVLIMGGNHGRALSDAFVINVKNKTAKEVELTPAPIAARLKTRKSSEVEDSEVQSETQDESS